MRIRVLICNFTIIEQKGPKRSKDQKFFGFSLIQKNSGVQFNKVQINTSFGFICCVICALANKEFE